MNIHEYQAKEILTGYGVPVPRGAVAESASAAEAIARELGGASWAVKAQVHAGGRGKAGGVRLAASPEAVAEAAGQLLDQRLVTSQTGPAGKEVKRVYVEQGLDIQRECYLAVLVDRSLGRVSFLAASRGGEDIQTLAATEPERILRCAVDPAEGFSGARAGELAVALGFESELLARTVDLMGKLYQAFIETDASLIEINPLAVTKDGALQALDVKMILDDNALFRHAELEALRDEDEVDPSELEAKRFELNYVKLGGDIGVMVNGAGLALATVDILKEYGGAPADFMDVRPVATRAQIATGFKMLLANPDVKAILVNVYGGGILRCDTIAEGVAAACKEVGLSVPLVVRAAGTNKEMAEKILVGQGIPVTFARDMAEAAVKVIAAAKREAA
ncbi:MAG: ADP-forming succinate--CoA ligase subunit beta [Rhodospirillales bacterium]|nr:ADP-forming succinate--CoA ligase subunit beta [Rhodospirillales bacterium]